jgi:branched-chain amino acid transport system permease protein
MMRLWRRPRPEQRPDPLGRWTLPVGLVLLALVTLLATVVLSIANLSVFDSVLLACLGAIALTVLTGTAGQVSIGNSAFLAVGGFATIWALRAGIPFPADIIVATVVSAVVGLIVGLPGVRLRGLELALATLAAFFIVSWATNQYETDTPGASAGFNLPTLFESKGLSAGGKYWAWLLYVILGLVIIGAYRLRRGKLGRALRIIRDHELVAPSLGIPVTRYKLLLFAGSSAVIGLQGSLFAYFLGSVTSGTYTLTLAIQYLAMVIIGGLDSIPGAILGAAIVTVLPTLLTSVLTPIMGTQAAIDAPQIASISYFALLIVMLAVAPEGLAPWGSRAVRALWARTGGRSDDDPGPADGKESPTSRSGRGRHNRQSTSV